MKRFLRRMQKRHKVLFPLIVFFVFLVLANLSYKLSYPKYKNDLAKIGVVLINDIIFSTSPYLEQIENFEKDDQIKAIILEINSPGGAVAPVQEIFDTLLKARETKPIYTNIETIAASGGYYLASASDKIYALRGSTVGSIGVIFQYVQYGDLLEKIGIKPIVIKSGKHKDIISPFRSPSQEEREIIQNLVNESFQEFVSDIAIGRGLLN